MNLYQFKKTIAFQEPLLCVQGDIFETPADHIAFAVNYPNGNGEFNNSGGFAGEVCRQAWPELKNIKFTKGETRSHRYCGKIYHAIAVHSNEPDGWKDTPELIELCLNKLPVDSTEVIAIVLIGGGKAGKKWKANINNLIGMSRTYKTIALYVKEPELRKALMELGIICQSIPLNFFPKTKKYRAELAA
ncbi:MAG: hypothetical protein WC523_02345 [Patescibacteria group bacterium]